MIVSTQRLVAKAGEFASISMMRNTINTHKQTKMKITTNRIRCKKDANPVTSSHHVSGRLQSTVFL